MNEPMSKNSSSGLSQQSCKKASLDTSNTHPRDLPQDSVHLHHPFSAIVQTIMANRMFSITQCWWTAGSLNPGGQVGR